MSILFVFGRLKVSVEHTVAQRVHSNVEMILKVYELVSPLPLAAIQMITVSIVAQSVQSVLGINISAVGQHLCCS